MRDENVRLNNAIRHVMTTTSGREFVWSLIEYCGLYHDISGEPNQVNRMLGKRSVALYIMAITNDVDESLVMKMIQESQLRDKMKEKERERKDRDNRDNDYFERNYGADVNDRGELYDLPDDLGARGQHEYGADLI